MGKLNKQVIMAYEPDPIPIGDDAGAKKLARAINDLVKVVAWDETNEAHATLRDHLKNMSKELRGGSSSDDDAPEITPEKKPAGTRSRGRPPMSPEEKAKRKAEREAKEAAGEAPKKRRGRPPGSKNKKEDKSNGSGTVQLPGSDSPEVPESISLEAGADADSAGDDDDPTAGIF